MSNAPELDAAGLPEELSPLDQILHRGEANPRTRSGIMTVELLDTTPDWGRFRARFENASRKVLRLRQKVVTPTRKELLSYTAVVLIFVCIMMALVYGIDFVFAWVVTLVFGTAS